MPIADDHSVSIMKIILLELIQNCTILIKSIASIRAILNNKCAKNIKYAIQYKLANLSILLEQLRRLRQRPINGRPRSTAPGGSGGSHQSFARHRRASVRLVLHYRGARRNGATNAHFLHLVRERVQQTDDLRRRSGGRDARYEYAAVVDRWANSFKLKLAIASHILGLSEIAYYAR